jgi:hypothetical protein
MRETVLTYCSESSGFSLSIVFHYSMSGVLKSSLVFELWLNTLNAFQIITPWV